MLGFSTQTHGMQDNGSACYLLSLASSPITHLEGSQSPSYKICGQSTDIPCYLNLVDLNLVDLNLARFESNPGTLETHSVPVKRCALRI